VTAIRTRIATAADVLAVTGWAPDAPNRAGARLLNWIGLVAERDGRIVALGIAKIFWTQAHPRGPEESMAWGRLYFEEPIWTPAMARAVRRTIATMARIGYLAIFAAPDADGPLLHRLGFQRCDDVPASPQGWAWRLDTRRLAAWEGARRDDARLIQ
jgi:hypothetical protein